MTHCARVSSLSDLLVVMFSHPSPYRSPFQDSLILNIVIHTQHRGTSPSCHPALEISGAFVDTIPRLVTTAPTVRTPCQSPASLLKSRTLVMVSPVNQNRYILGRFRQELEVSLGHFTQQSISLNTEYFRLSKGQCGDGDCKTESIKGKNCVHETHL